MMYQLPPLPYPKEALSPAISAETIDFHYGKHFQTYVNKLNELIKGTLYEDMELPEIICKAAGALDNNAAQAWNHDFYFEQLSPTPTEMSPRLSALIMKSFGTIEKFKEELLQNATTLFGAGWTWVVLHNDETLTIENESNAGNPLTRGLRPILTLDVWEHAYYIDYRNNRAEHLKQIWGLINWNVVEERAFCNECNVYI